jgi:transposase
MRGGPVADRRLDPAALHPTATFVDGWLQARPRDWLAQVGTVALDPWRGYASALVAPLGHVTVVGDHVHAIRLANAVADQARRRMQQATMGHRGRTYDSPYRIRKLLVTAAEQLIKRPRAQHGRTVRLTRESIGRGSPYRARSGGTWEVSAWRRPIR